MILILGKSDDNNSSNSSYDNVKSTIEAANVIEPSLLTYKNSKRICWHDPRGTRLATTLAHFSGFYGPGKNAKRMKCISAPAQLLLKLVSLRQGQY